MQSEGRGCNERRLRRQRHHSTYAQISEVGRDGGRRKDAGEYTGDGRRDELSKNRMCGGKQINRHTQRSIEDKNSNKPSIQLRTGTKTKNDERRTKNTIRPPPPDETTSKSTKSRGRADHMTTHLQHPAPFSSSTSCLPRPSFPLSSISICAAYCATSPPSPSP